MSKQFGRAAAALLALCLTVPGALVARQQGGGRPAAAAAAEVLAATSEMLEEVSRMRGLKILSPVKSGLKSRGEIEQVVVRNFDESSTPEELEAAQKTLIAFGLAPRDFRYREFMIKLLAEQVAGFYQPKTKEFFLADWNALDQQKTVMAHELVHALQDQHFDLRRFEKWPRGDGDRETAIHALIEGDATAVMFNYLLKPRGMEITKLPISLSALGEMMPAQGDKPGEEVLAAAPAAIRESLIFPYTYGAGFAQEMVKRRGWEGLTQAYAELPQSTEQIMHFDKYLAREAPAKVALADLAPLLGPGWRRIDADVNGEFGYSLVLGEYLPRKQARAAAAGWAGDQCAVYEQAAEGRVLLAHLSAWDSEDEAHEFFGAYGARTAKRYPNAPERPGAGASERAYRTSDGETYMARRGARVLIIEGLPEGRREELPRLAAALWR